MASKHRQLLDLYTQILASVNLICDEKGLISFALQPTAEEIAAGSPGMDPIPAAIEGKRLALPTPEALDERGYWDTHTAFHPLSENFLNGESPVLAKLKAAINLHLSATIAELMGWLVKFASEPELHANGNVGAKAMKYLQLVPNIKEITSERMMDIIKKAQASQDKRFVNLYLKRGGDILDSRYQWACITTFPFRLELDGADPKVFGVKISQKDQASYKALFDYILPDSDHVETYSAGSKIKSACKFDAVLRAYGKVATRLNEVIHLHRKIIPTYKELSIKVDWLEELGNLDKLADIVPALPGNEGDSPRERRTEGAATSRVPPSAPSARAQQLFGNEEKATPAAEERPRPTEPRRVEIERQPTAAPAEPKEVQEESFSERMRRRFGGAALGAPAQAFNQSRNYENTARAANPPWVENEGTRFNISGDPKVHPLDQNRHRFIGDNPATSFAERHTPSLLRSAGSRAFKL